MHDDRDRPGGHLAPLVLSVVVCLGFTCFPAVAEASVRVRPMGGRLDFILMGFAVFQTDLTAESERFFDSSDQLPADFTNRQVLNLRVEGDYSERVDVEARVQFDRENLRDWRYLARVAGPGTELQVGELAQAFADTQFTRYDTPFYGVQGKVELGGLATSAFTTTRDGGYRVDRLRGTELSGPYILSASPVLEGSERVAIEVRNRNDEEEILSSDHKLSGVDYRIDYATGTLRFVSPIESRTFDGDPVYVLVEYQFATRGAESRALTGGRVVFGPSRALSLGTTYLREGAGADTILSQQGILGLDQKLAFGNWFRLQNELAGPRGDLLDRSRGAWHLDGSVKPHDTLDFRVRFRRVGKDFEATANPTLDSQLDRQNLDLDLSFVPTLEHRLTAGYGIKSDDVADDPEVDETRTRTYRIAWEGQMQSWPVLGVRLERRLTDGAGTLGGSGSSLDTVSLDAEDDLGRWWLAGPTSLRAQYRFERLREDAADDRLTHNLNLRFDSRPRRSLETSFEVRTARSPRSGLVGSASTYEMVLGGHYRPPESKLQFGASLRWRTTGNDPIGMPEETATRTSAIFDALYEPSDRLRAWVKYEQTLSTGSSDSDNRTRNVFARATAVPFTGLTASFGYQLDDQSGERIDLAGDRNGEYYATLQYKVRERLTLFGRAERGRSSERLPPFEDTESMRTTWLSGLSFDFTRNWNVTSEFKTERLTGATEGFRRAVIGELSRSFTDFFRIGLGIRFTLDEQGDIGRLDEQRIYLKAIGTL